MRTLLRLLAELGLNAILFVVMLGGLAAVLVVYLGIAMLATLRAGDPNAQQMRYRVFRDLLEFIRRRHR